MSTQTDMQAVAAALRENDRFLVTSHEAPDGDALGSLLGMGLALRELGKDVVMFLGGPAPLPGEYRFLDLEQRGLVRTRPADFGERVLVAVDCASAGRVGAEPGVVDAAPFTINIDHHHDNPRFGDVNLIVPDASSTGEVLADVLPELGVALTPEIAEALYIALVTDTGRFQYANTSPKALRLAADLVEAGADVHRVFQGVYENVQFAKLKLLARALERAHVLEGGEIVVSHLLRGDFEAVGDRRQLRRIEDRGGQDGPLGLFAVRQGALLLEGFDHRTGPAAGPKGERRFWPIGRRGSSAAQRPIRSERLAGRRDAPPGR
jgi:phosphoesterase RecJ-like protein